MVKKDPELRSQFDMTFNLPRPLRRHSIVQALLATKFITPEQLISFNENAKAFVNLNDPEPRNIFLKSVFEPEFFVIAKTFLGKYGIFFDLGANIGFCSFGLVPDRPESSYHLFEANPYLINLLERSIELHPHQKFFLKHACISDRAGTTRFQLTPNQTGQSHVAIKKDEGIEISNLALDDYCSALNLDSVDFAKIDIEGQELPALHGWKKCLSAHKTKAVYIEIMPENQARYGYETNAPLVFLESLGYRLFLCKPDDFGTFGSTPENHTFADGVLPLSEFRAEDYPSSFATDVLALAKK